MLRFSILLKKKGHLILPVVEVAVYPKVNCSKVKQTKAWKRVFLSAFRLYWSAALMDGWGLWKETWGRCLPKGPGAPPASSRLIGSDAQASIPGISGPWHPGYGSKEWGQMQRACRRGLSECRCGALRGGVTGGPRHVAYSPVNMKHAKQTVRSDTAETRTLREKAGRTGSTGSQTPAAEGARAEETA